MQYKMISVFLYFRCTIAVYIHVEIVVVVLYIMVQGQQNRDILFFGLAACSQLVEAVVRCLNPKKIHKASENFGRICVPLSVGKQEGILNGAINDRRKWRQNACRNFSHEGSQLYFSIAIRYRDDELVSILGLQQQSKNIYEEDLKWGNFWKSVKSYVHVGQAQFWAQLWKLIILVSSSLGIWAQ